MLIKSLISIDGLSISGFDLFNIIHDDYGIQLELGERYVGLGIIALGTKKEHIDRMLDALRDISKRFYDPSLIKQKNNYPTIATKTILKPRDVFNAPVKKVKLEEAIGKISKESIMTYPPGIPVIIAGEEFNQEIIDRIKYYKTITGRVIMDYDDGCVSIVDEEKM